MFKIFSHTYRKNHWSYGLQFFSDTILLLKVECFEGILNWIKIDGMVMIIRAAVTRSDLKNIAKNHLQFLAMPTSTTTETMAWKIFPATMQLLKN